MCLDSSKTKQKAFIRDLKFGKDKYVKLWKVFDVDEEDNLVAQFHDYKFKKGKNTAKGEFIKTYSGGKSDYQYKPGFHCFSNKKDAEAWEFESNNMYNRKRVVLPVKVRKSWITNVGIQSGNLVLVCKHIFI